jgi:hypothetical protein
VTALEPRPAPGMSHLAEGDIGWETQTPSSRRKPSVSTGIRTLRSAGGAREEIAPSWSLAVTMPPLEAG